MNNQTFSLQYFDERTDEWRYAGHTGRFLAPIQDRLNEARILCADTVSYRIVATM